jgi:acetyltransferase-like isoleucine patch superfamily enzyme
MKIGKNTFISPSAILNGKNIKIGDGCYIGDNVQILVDDFELGDYCKIHNKTTLHGYKPMKIGHNAWIGQGTIIDSIGGTTIGNNCGIGAYSQLWSHIRYGDPLEGCNYESEKPLIIGDDVWFVGHCIVSPVNVEDKSMALVGSVITKDMKYNRIYGGSPAKDLTDKIKPQFSEITIEKKREIMKQFVLPENIKIIENEDEIVENNISYFNIKNRKYTKRGTDEEYHFMKLLQNKLIKFIPYAD